MSDRVERVARAIGAVIGEYSESYGWLGPQTREICLMKARAAIEAMSEPNAETIAAIEELEAGGGEVFIGTSKDAFDHILKDQT